jgi:tRNA threonylcarbamoyladenosine biosynthesis protein TsaE
MKTKTTHSPEETRKLGADLARKILAGKPKKYATVVSLYGNLGSGKTTWVQGFLKEAGWKKRVTSPTFILMRRHPLRRKSFKNVYHLDAYRLKIADLKPLGFEEIYNDPQNIILVEWPENLLGRKNGKTKVRFLHGKKENERKIKIQ